MADNKIIAAILTIAASARHPRTTSQEVGKEHWQRVLKDYEQILKELEKTRG